MGKRLYDTAILKKKGFKDYWIVHGRKSPYEMRHYLQGFCVFDWDKKFWKVLNITGTGPRAREIKSMGLKLLECKEQS